ncbi:MAG: DUF177 domain-containing protein [Alphaproteobacteria bacterium]|nr:DUF177 domain-containing protein [Alphaproteobacteria bacterium]
MAASAPRAEFSRLVEVDRLGEDGLRLSILADEAERQALARRFGLIALDELRADIEVSRPIAGGPVRAVLDWQARVVQSCVVTLEPVPASLADRAVLLYAEEAQGELAPAGTELELDLAEEDPPDPIVGGRIDLGEAAAEQLALALDPYPRRPGARLPSEPAGEEGSGAGDRATPFSVLAKLKEKK